MSKEAVAEEEEVTLRDVAGEAWDEAMGESEEEEIEEEEQPAPTPDLDVEEEDDDDPDRDEADLDPDADADDEEEDDEGEGEDEDTAKAPQSWSPEAREVWAEVPERARKEVEKRELEMQQRLSQAAEDTKMSRAFNQAIDPYRSVIQMEAGGDAIRATASLMDLATRLRMGTPQEKSQVVADIIKNYAVDLGNLDDTLYEVFGSADNPKQTPAPAAAPQPTADPRVDAMWQEKQAQTGEAERAAQAEFDSFMADPKNEFANDVSNEMGLVFQNASQRGEQLTLDQAYERAVAMRPDIQNVIAGRAAPAADNTTSLKRKRRAAKGIKSSSTQTPAGEAKDLRGILSDKWDEAERA